ncbi:MAG: thermonuclease family protein [Candidatus Latescibacteria bacterium]|nr:thermonuclease family protein [Candidatus Latescibacterota bacterium]
MRVFTVKRLASFSSLVLLAIIFTFLFRQAPEAPDTATVVRVIDGDTFEITYRRQKERIRLIGIDTPESKANKKAERDAGRSKQDIRTVVSQGKEAVYYVKRLVKPGDTVKIEFDVQQKDHYGRLLGYVYLSNGNMLNEEIIGAGYANVMTIPPNVKYQKRLLAAYRKARENQVGLWGE